LHRTAAAAVVVVGALGVAVSTARPAPEESAPPRRVEVVASRYAFAPAVIEAHQGEALDLELRSADTDHGFAIKPYGLKVAIPKGGAVVRVLLVADKPGRFPIECSEYCGSGHKRMRGELVVAEAGR
jgi:cytochrome c oxidase subunit II